MDDYFVNDQIVVRPPVCAPALDRLAAAGFVPVGPYVADKEVCVVAPYQEPDAGYSLIKGSNSEGTRNGDGIGEHLTELVDLLGAGYTYTGGLVVDGPTIDESCRILLVRSPGDSGQAGRWQVVTRDAALIHPADYAIPNGSAVAFDAAAARVWLQAKTRDPHGHGRWDYRVVPDRFYTYDDQPSDWLARLVPDLSDNAVAPHVWRTAEGVRVRVVETVSDEAPTPDGGCVLTVAVGGLTLASQWLAARDLSAFEVRADGTTDKVQLDAAVEALDVVATTVTMMVEHHRVVRAADAHVSSPLADLGPLSARLGADNIECALRTLADLAANGIGDPHDVLSARQKSVVARLVDLVAAEDA